MPDWVKLVVLVLILDYAMIEATGWFVERGKAVAIERGCHSPRCIKWEWWFSRQSPLK